MISIRLVNRAIADVVVVLRPVTATVTVSPTPQFVNPIAGFEICNGGTLNIASQLLSTVAGADFIWSATTSNVNMPAISGTKANIDQVVTLINGFQNGTINIEVKPQIGSCFGTSQQILITVKPYFCNFSTKLDNHISLILKVLDFLSLFPNFGHCINAYLQVAVSPSLSHHQV